MEWKGDAEIKVERRQGEQWGLEYSKEKNNCRERLTSNEAQAAQRKIWGAISVHQPPMGEWDHLTPMTSAGGGGGGALAFTNHIRVQYCLKRFVWQI